MRRHSTRSAALLAACTLVWTAAAASQSAVTGSQHPSPVPAQGVDPGRFIDVTQKVGVSFQHQALHTTRKYLLETMGSGVALFDCDNDGRLDLFLVNGAPYK